MKAPIGSRLRRWIAAAGSRECLVAAIVTSPDPAAAKLALMAASGDLSPVTLAANEHRIAAQRRVGGHQAAAWRSPE